MSTKPDADELRIRQLLRKQGVGPDADWWTPNPDTPVEEAPPPDRGPVFTPDPDYWPRAHMPAAVTTVPARAAAAISPRTRRALYNASAAGAGWGIGLYGKFAWAITDCGHSQGIPAALVLGVGGALVIAHVWDRRTRHWWPGIAWCARIPLATALLAVALYTPVTV